ncbi:restriction endonuclease subunit S [Pseudoalteromonas sp. SG41-2]|uniref:restriction endonuclease subunit S n=1 Tax=Pseudoalteromonas sp. SG41-2 TaxID=2760978 RepID=UPI0016011D8E|nr:restriction endonuclease subunit S [Pseudoalteromonas sp. SG41-2]MBB1479595.1 restriction endonuclease subunit S [Pseudoalteromonas sp. SG41-2]
MSTIDLVPDGFKKSDVGVIPKTWDIKPFGECFNIIAGLGFGKSEYTQSGLNLLRIDNVSYGKVIWDSIAYLPENYVNKYPHLILQAGDLLLALNRPITNGKLKLAKLAPHDLPSILYQRVGKISTSDKNIDLNFAFFLLTKFIKLFVEESAVGTDQPFISTTKLKKCVLPIPPKEEQTAIANALSDVDALLTELENLITKKQAIKTATMQQLLTGKTRLPQFATYTEGADEGKRKGTKSSELGKIPEDWDVEKIGSVVSITTGSRNTQDKLSSGKYPFFVRSQTIERIDTYSFDGEAVLTAGDGVGTGKIFHYINGKFDYHQRVYLMHNFGDRIDGYYFYIYFSNFFYDRIMSMTAKSSVDSVRREMIADMLITLPPKEEQVATATILSDMDNEIQTLEQRLTKTRQIKQGMMQQLLSGRTRLPFKKLETKQDGGS